MVQVELQGGLDLAAAKMEEHLVLEVQVHLLVELLEDQDLLQIAMLDLVVEELEILVLVQLFVHHLLLVEPVEQEFNFHQHSKIQNRVLVSQDHLELIGSRVVEAVAHTLHREI